MRTISVEWIDDPADNQWWKQVMQLFLKPGCAFEIRCWREEQEIVKEILGYGRLSVPDCTDYEVSVRGSLTAPIIQNLLHAKKKEGQMTPFFTINVENRVSSSHYGKEVYLFDPAPEVLDQLHEILEPIQNDFSFGEYA